MHVNMLILLVGYCGHGAVHVNSLVDALRALHRPCETSWSGNAGMAPSMLTPLQLH